MPSIWNPFVNNRDPIKTVQYFEYQSDILVPGDVYQIYRHIIDDPGLVIGIMRTTPRMIAVGMYVGPGEDDMFGGKSRLLLTAGKQTKYPESSFYFLKVPKLKDETEENQM